MEEINEVPISVLQGYINNGDFFFNKLNDEVLLNCRIECEVCPWDFKCIINKNDKALEENLFFNFPEEYL